MLAPLSESANHTPIANPIHKSLLLSGFIVVAMVAVVALPVVADLPLHEVPMLVDNGLDVLPLACQFTLMVRVREDAAVRKDYVLADFGDLRVDLHLLADLDHVQEFSRERNGYGAHVRHPQHADRGDHVDHGRQGAAVDGLLDILLMGLKCVAEGCQFGIVLVSVQRLQTPTEILAKTTHQVRIGAVELQHLSSRKNSPHLNIYIRTLQARQDHKHREILFGFRLRKGKGSGGVSLCVGMSIWQYYTIVMQQQLIVSTIQILPATMEDVLYRLQTLLSAPSMQQSVLSNIVKSLFFGVWNFDKMINQHNLNTRIAEMLLKLPKKNALVFLKALLAHLHQKWNLIDHHRINKFMQLVRYLLVSAIKFCEKHKINKKKVDQILMDTIYNDKLMHNGLVFHVTDIYFKACDENLPNGVTLEDLGLFQSLLINQPSQHMRLYIIEHIYEKYKEKLVTTEQDLEKLEAKVQEFAAHFLQLARKEEKESHRKNLYAIVGYAKSEQLSFSLYMSQKRAKALAEQEKKKKKLTKAKVQEIKELKKKRKDKKKIGKKKDHKIMSVRKFQDKKGKFKKGIEEL